MRAISRRLERIEVQMRPALEAMRKAAVPEGPPTVEVLRANLARMGIEPEPSESLAETTARAMGINCQELPQQLCRYRYLRPCQPFHELPTNRTEPTLPRTPFVDNGEEQHTIDMG